MAAKVLLVDDVTMFLELQKAFLKLSSAHIITARDGQEALDVARSEQPALVIMDLHMPKMDGAQCCSHLKSDPLLRKIPVIMVTAAGKDDDRDLCIKAGCDDFLTKPLDRVLYLEKARRYLPTIDRRSPRIPCRLPAKFRAFGITLSGEISDASDNGVFLATDYRITAGTIVDVAFDLPAGPVVAKGRVAWLNTGDNRFKKALPEGFGIEFAGLADEVRKRLKSFVERHHPEV